MSCGPLKTLMGLQSMTVPGQRPLEPTVTWTEGLWFWHECWMFSKKGEGVAIDGGVCTYSIESVIVLVLVVCPPSHWPIFVCFFLTNLKGSQGSVAFRTAQFTGISCPPEMKGVRQGFLKLHFRFWLLSVAYTSWSVNQIKKTVLQ